MARLRHLNYLVAIALTVTAVTGCDTKEMNATMEVTEDCGFLRRGDPVVVRHGEGLFTAAFVADVHKDAGRVELAVPGLSGLLDVDCVKLRRPLNQ